MSSYTNGLMAIAVISVVALNSVKAPAGSNPGNYVSLCNIELVINDITCSTFLETFMQYFRKYLKKYISRNFRTLIIITNFKTQQNIHLPIKYLFCSS